MIPAVYRDKKYFKSNHYLVIKTRARDSNYAIKCMHATGTTVQGQGSHDITHLLKTELTTVKKVPPIIRAASVPTLLTCALVFSLTCPQIRVFEQ